MESSVFNVSVSAAISGGLVPVSECIRNSNTAGHSRSRQQICRRSFFIQSSHRPILHTLYDIQVTSLSPTPTMYSDLLDVLGNQGSSSITRSGSDSDNHVAVSFKAGKMKMELQEVRKIELAQAEQGIHSLTPSLVSIVFVFFYSFIYSCFCCLRNRCYLN